MSILSLQSIIQKYGANFGINAKAAVKDSAKDAGKNPAKASAANGTKAAPKKADAAKAKIPAVDSLKLSPAAKDFLASHTGHLGKFEMPNVLDAFMGALDGSDQNGSGSGSGNSLLDFLTSPGKANQGAGGSGTSASDAANPYTVAKGAPKSLLDFL